MEEIKQIGKGKLYKYTERYVFDSKEQFLEKKDKFIWSEDKEDFEPNFHSFIYYGHPVISEAETDVEGNVLKEEVLDLSIVLVNVIWRQYTAKFKQPWGWDMHHATPKNPLYIPWGFKK